MTTLPLIASMTVFSQNTYTYNYINPIYRQNIPVLWSVSPPLETRKRDVRTPLRCVRLHRTAHTAPTQMRAAAGFSSVHLPRLPLQGQKWRHHEAVDPTQYPIWGLMVMALQRDKTVTGKRT